MRMVKQWSPSELALSSNHKFKFNDDCFKIFEIHFPSKYSKDSSGYRIIWKDDAHTEKSLYNFLGTNCHAYAKLVNLCSDRLGKFIDPISNQGYSEMINLLHTDKDFVKTLLKPLAESIQFTLGLGSHHEKIVSELIVERLGAEEILLESGIAVKKDTHDGHDITFVKEGIKKSMQVKVARGVFENPTNYKVRYLFTKPYKNMDYYCFFYKGLYYFFENKNVRISGEDYFFDKSSFLLTCGK
jgi:hypothetical protein